MSFEDNLKIASIIFSLNFILYSSLIFTIFFLYKKNNIKLLKMFLYIYFILLFLSYIFNNSILIYLIIYMNTEYVFVPILNMCVSVYQLCNLFYFLKHKKYNPYVTLCINCAIIFFSMLNLNVIDEDELFNNCFMYILCIYGIISAIIFNFLTIILMYFKSHIDILFFQDNLYLELNEIIDDDCSICLEPLNVNVVKTKCNHYFHKTCILQSLVIKQNCPLCRTEISNDYPRISNQSPSDIV